MAVSQLSPGSSVPLPQSLLQSVSVCEVAPGGQHPSPLIDCVI
jgi:hypothetical protein